MSRGQVSRVQRARRTKPNRVNQMRLPSRCRRVLFEPLEPRILLSSNPLSLGAAAGAAVDLTLCATNDSAPPTIEVTDDALGAHAAAGQALSPAGGAGVAGPRLPALQLVDNDPAALAGQVFYLDPYGASGVTYNGPVHVDGIDVPAFRAPAPLAGEEAGILGVVLADLKRDFAGLGVTFTDVRPAAGTAYSTVFLGGNDAAFAQYGSFYGLAEKVDVGNRDRNDDAFVFSDKVFAAGMTAGDYESALTAVIDHEARHLLGYEHAGGGTAGLSAVAAGAPALPDGATITVNSAEDSNTRDGLLTLREAILVSNRTLAVSDLTDAEKAQVNGTPGADTRDTIDFKIPGAGIHTIFVGAGGLPYITDPVIIDGTSQPGYASTPLVDVYSDGAGVNQNGKDVAGLEITAGNSVVKGMSITGSPGDGIRLRNGGGNTIVGNFIGTDAAGKETGSVFRNNGSGILILDSPNNQIGGRLDNPGERNLISGNAGEGIVISGGASTGNQVQGNLIGTDITGAAALGNALQGVLITAPVGGSDYASGNLVGGLGVLQGNVISANGIDGVEVVRGAGNVIQGNLVGTTQDGTKALGNREDGVFVVDAPGTQIGGTDPLAINVVSANGKDGIEIVGSGATGTVIRQNYIGTDLATDQALGNGEDGIFIHGQLRADPRLFPVVPAVSGVPSDAAAPSTILTTIGGDAPSAGNFISGNERDGVRLADGTTGTLIQANYIGVNGFGNAALGNKEYGVAILDSAYNTVSGAATINGVLAPYNQVIAGNHYGVYISGTDAKQNRVAGNLIGLDETGTKKIENGAGVFIDIGAGDNTVGGTTPQDRNIISGNALGVVLFGYGNTVSGDYIGTDESGAQAVGNTLGGVDISGDNNVIGGKVAGTGNVISGNLAYGVHIRSTGSGNQIQGNFIGTDGSGAKVLANSLDGVFIEGASANTVGGPADPTGVAPGNVIAGNLRNGVFIGGADAALNTVQGNFIGLNSAGGLLGNGEDGVRVEKAPDNTIGGAAVGEGNVISGNSNFGVVITGTSATGNKVLGNFIGTDTAGTFALGNFGGIFIVEAADNVIGGTAAGAGNLISGNIGSGIDLFGGGATGNQVQGNLIGTDHTGNLRLANSKDGVLIEESAQYNRIGGLTTPARNVISGNVNSGIRIQSEATGNLVEGNFIGVGADGTTEVGNEEHGIFIENSNDNSIGGSTVGAGNTIAFNGSSLQQKGHGVVVASGTGNLISHNSIYNNAGRGIDLGNDSFNLNHQGAAVGANNLQNYPVVVSVEFFGALKNITWDLSGMPNTNYTLEFYANDLADPSGFGEGKKFLQRIPVTTDKNGFSEFTVVFNATDKLISATATDPLNNTSEFSMVDTDADSLADAWEDPGLTEDPAHAGYIDINEDGIPDLMIAGRVNSEGVAVSAYHKDLFVEVDAMSGSNEWGLLAPPTQAMLNTVVDAFAQAPNDLVHNPDGQDGITLHAFLDDTGITPQAFLDPAHKFVDLNYVKLNYFGTAAERSQPDWTTTGRAAKELVYRYALFADTQSLGTRSNSGFSELAITPSGLGLGGSDLAITLGSWVRDASAGTMGGTDQEQAGTFMHELGHTLGLFHGGNQILPGPDGKFGTQDDQDVNNKPNYHSVMNYLWQMPEDWMQDLPGTDSNKSGIIGDSLWSLDYSRQYYPNLNESALIEANGIGGQDYTAVEIGPLPNGKKEIAPETGPYDFNQNGSIDPTPVSANLNGGPPGQLLTGYEDWSHLRFDFRDVSSYGLGAAGEQSPLADQELTPEMRDQMNAVGDGPGFFKFSETNTFRVNESAGFATVSVVRSSGIGGTVSVDFATSDDTAAAGVDYTATSGTLTFGDGEYLKTFRVPILNDGLSGPAKAFGVTLSNPTGGATLGPVAEARVSILNDNGAGSFQLGSPFYVVKETDGTATITVTRTGGAVGAVSVDFATQDDSATAGQDYTATAGTLDFADGETSKTFTVPILDDSIVGGLEALKIKLSNPGGGATLGRISAGTLIIQDVEPGILQFSAPTYQISESGGAATVTVTRTNGADGAVSVDFTTADGTATASSDYTAASGTLTFGDGQTVQSFTVPILEDTLAEPTETVSLSLSNPTGGSVIGPQSGAQLNILDDEPPTLQFSAASFSVNESAGSATVQVVRTGVVNEAVSVNFATADGTAKAGTDYTATSGTLTFAAGDTSETITVPVLNNKVADGDRTLQLLLTNPSADAQVGTAGAAALTIVDDESAAASTFVVTNTNDGGPGSLRQAILDANAHAGIDLIHFDIPGAGVHTIQPLSALPTITGPVTIDGYSQPGAAANTLSSGDDAVLRIELDGSRAGRPDGLLHITAGNSIVRGLAIDHLGYNGVGILIEGNGGDVVAGNFIGTDASGTSALGNYSGIEILGSSDNLIGGTAPSSRNVISGNVHDGILIESLLGHAPPSPNAAGNRILGNYIGVAADGTSPLGNYTGIEIGTDNGPGPGGESPGNLIGGVEPGAGNVIAFNLSTGVSITSGSGNAVRGNSIFSNDPAGQSAATGPGGIDLASGDPLQVLSRPYTVNDPGDADTGDSTVLVGNSPVVFPGPNKLQNFPVLSSALSSGGTLTILGRLDSAPGTTFQVDFYSNEQIDSSGQGEGRTYIGSAAVTTDATGHAEFSTALPVDVPDGRFITATATDPGNNTSEFSARITVGDVLGNVYVVNTTADHDNGVADATDTTLREAILAANNHPGPDTILFDIPGTGVQTIRPLTPLPAITGPVTIDGYSQPGASPNTQAVGYDGNLLIEIRGPGNSGGAWSQISPGLDLAGGGSTVRGLVIDGMADALLVQGAGSNLIEGNIIGPDPTGHTNGYFPEFAGHAPLIVAGSSNNTIGGATPQARNLLAGVLLKFGADDNRVQGNTIGPRADGMGTLLGSRGMGVSIDGSSANLIGGAGPGEGNVISGNGVDGIQISGSSNRVLGNFIGVGADGVLPLGNGLAGGNGTGINVQGEALGNVIGGIEPGAGNIIAWSETSGVHLSQTTDPSGAVHIPAGNAIRGNSIFSNGSAARSLQVVGLGIDLQGDNYTPNTAVAVNDNGDVDGGPNNLQNFPVLSSALSSGGTLTIQGRLDSTPGTTFQVDFYSNDQIDSSGHGEGQTYIGSAAVTTDATGHAEFSTALPVDVPDGRFITATATDPGNNTSEFSARITVGDVLGNVYVVNTTADHDNGVADATDTTLREAILAANNHPGPDTILFDIPGTGVQEIQPLTPLPAITDPVTIDGYSQPGSSPNTLAQGDNAVPLIEINGGRLQNLGYRLGLYIRAGATTVRGLVINGFDSAAIDMEENGGNTIAGNFLGTDPTGTTAPGRGGVRIFASSDNVIGGTAPEARNIIAGSGSTVQINGFSGAASDPRVAFYYTSGNVVEGNYIGTDKNGTAALGGSVSVSAAADNTIGGTTPGARNVISGGGGVYLGGDAVKGTPANNILEGNYIGTDSTGEAALGGSGVSLNGTGNIVGGAVPGAGNLISGNGGSGLVVGEGSHVVQGNFIGTDVNGTAPLGNGRDGVDIFSSGNTIGGPAPGAGNVISGNAGNGITMGRTDTITPALTGNVIQGNLIGTQADGASPLGNLGEGISVPNTAGVGAVNDTIGGLDSGAGNTIAFNGQNGVNVQGGLRIAILSNSIFSNGKLGIDLNGDGPTPNDAGDGDGGNNNLQNFPVLTSVDNTGTGITVQGTLNSRPNGTYTLQFFDNIAFDSSNFGEGRRLIGTTSVTTSSTGDALFAATFPVAVPAADVVTATATDAQGNTSEFSGRATGESAGATADLAVTASDAPDPVLAGQALAYTVTVVNNGPDAATNVILTDTLPAGASFDSAVLSQGASGLVGSTVMTDLGTVESGATATVRINVASRTPGVAINVARAAGDQYDPDTSNNTASESTTILPSADLSVVKSTNATAPVGAGSTVFMTLTVTNQGPSTASAVHLTDTLPDSMTFAYFAGGMAGTVSNGLVTWNLGNLGSGSSAAVSFEAVVNQPGTSTDLAEVTSATADPDPANNSSTLDLTVLPTADLGVTESAAPQPAAVGTELTYTLTLNNSGPSAAAGVVLKDTLPDSVTFDSASSSQGSFVLANGVVSFALGTLSSGAAATAEIAVTPTVAGAVLTNAAEVTATGTLDPNQINDQTSSQTLVPPAVLFGAASAGGRPSSLYAIDPATGAAALIGPIGFNRVSGIDFDPATGILYGTGELPDTGAPVLITIDPLTGAGTEVGPTDIGSINSNNTATDISFRGSDSALFAYLMPGKDLATIDTTGGEAAAVGATSAGGSAGNGLAFGPDGTLYHADDVNLDSVDPQSGLATPLAPLSFPAVNNFSRLNAMDFDPKIGTLFASLNDRSGNYLASVDVATGAVSLIGPTVGGLDAIAVAPAQAVNHPPVPAPIGDHSVKEGSVFSQTGGFTDPDSGDSWTATVDYGDGSGVQALALNGTEFQLNHVFADEGVYPVTVAITDSAGAVGTGTGKVTVQNVAPVLANLAATTIDENGVTTLSGKIADPGTLDTFTLDVNWGDPLSPKNVEQYAFAAGTTDFSLSHQYLDDNPSGTPADTYTIGLKVTDDGGGSSTASAPVTVRNVAPVLANLAATTIDENGVTTLSGKIADPGTLDTFTLDVNWGDPLSPKNVEQYAFAAGTTDFSLSHQYLDDNPSGTPADTYTIGLKVTDDDGGSSTASAPVTVRNVAPVITKLTNSAPCIGDAREEQSVSVCAAFTDVGTLDTHTAKINWDDGITTIAKINEKDGSGSISGSHIYEQGGIYKIEVTLLDDDTGTVTQETTAAVTGAGLKDGVLRIVGTAGRDKVEVESEGRCDRSIEVEANFLTGRGHERKFRADAVSRIVILTGDGNDRVLIDKEIHKPVLIDGGAGDDLLKAGSGPAILLGGAGNDVLIGGAGNDILAGGAGNDLLKAGGGRDLLIGGGGADFLEGGCGDDLLIAGSTQYDTDTDALNSLLKEWSRRDLDYSQRVSDLMNGGGLNGTLQLNETTVFGDSARDILRGGEGQDWFFADACGVEGDRITDLRSSEVVTRPAVRLADDSATPGDHPHHKPVIAWSEDSRECLEESKEVGNGKRDGDYRRWIRHFVGDLAAAGGTVDSNADFHVILRAPREARYAGSRCDSRAGF